MKIFPYLLKSPRFEITGISAEKSDEDDRPADRIPLDGTDCTRLFVCMDNLARKFLTEEEYLNHERNSNTKNEFFRGEIFAMAGAKEKHNLIVTNMIRDLSTALKKTPCRVYPSDMRVKVSASGLYTYPDISLVCEKPNFADGRNDTLLNPSVIIEVLSESTESYDRGKKFELYRTLPSLKEYILISSDQKKLESFLNRTDGWILQESGTGNSFLIRSLNILLDIEDIYDKTEMSEERLKNIPKAE